MTDREELITLDEAKQIGTKYVRSKIKEGIIEPGTVIECFDGTLRLKDGKPWIYEVAVRTGDPASPYYVVKILPFRQNCKVVGAKKAKYWSAEQAPDIEYITPPDVITWLKLKKEAESKIEEKVE